MITLLNKTISNHGKHCQAKQGDVAFIGDDLLLDTNSLDLFQGSRDELREAALRIISQPAAVPQFPLARDRGIKSLVLNVTHACQLRCDYCYLVNSGVAMQGNMTEEIARAAIEFAMPKDATAKFHVSFFGGEALLNFKLIAFVVEHLGFLRPTTTFGITTNGCLITPEIAEFFRKHRFSVVLSLDGTKRIHDLHRKHADGSGTFEAVMRGLCALKVAGVRSVTLRATFLPDCTALLERTVFLNHLCQAGYARNVSIEPACVAEFGCQAPRGFSHDEMRAVDAEYQQVAAWLSQEITAHRPANFQGIMTYVRRIFSHRCAATECGAGVGYVTVSPTGSIHACHRETATQIGSVLTGGINEAQRQPWLDNRYYCSSKCCVCSIKNICGGGCRENALRVTDDITKRVPEACEFIHTAVSAAARVVALCRHEDLSRLDVKPKSGPRYSLVREAGGFGDVINMGAAALAIKAQHSDAQVLAQVPNEFMSVAEHLSGVDAVAGLGPLDYLSRHRRHRNSTMSAQTHPYLVGVDFDTKVVDLWCPGTDYENRITGPVLKTRAELFAQAALRDRGTPPFLPVWNVKPEERIRASQYFYEKWQAQRPVIGLAPRGTDVARSLPASTVVSLHNELQRHFNVIYLDCVDPVFASQLTGYSRPSADFVDMVALVEQMDAVVSVDSACFHAAIAVATPVVGLFSKTDASPYTEFKQAPWVTAIQSMGSLSAPCRLPCNNSAQKGMTHECEGSLCRRQFDQFDDLTKQLDSVLKTLLAPAAQEEKLKRLKLTVEHPQEVL